MQKEDSWKDEPVRFFHICTDGTSNGIIHTSVEDYEMATKLCAICAYFNDVNIICHAHMSSHSHFLVSCSSRAKAVAFSIDFKREYGRYMQYKHGVSGVYRYVGCSIVEILDVVQLKRCICYILLNPVVPKIVVRPEDYRWSSFNTYFNPSGQDGIRYVKDLTTREIRALFHTHQNIKKSGFAVDSSGNIVLQSFINFRLVEKLFGGKTEFYRALSLTDSIKEEGLYVTNVVRYNDNELFAEAVLFAKRKYGTGDIHSLTHDQKLSLLLPIWRKTKASFTRIARVLRLPTEEVGKLLHK